MCPESFDNDSAIPDWLDELCDRFEAKWGTDDSVDIESLLSKLPAEKRDIALKPLLQLEYELRSGQNDVPTAEEFRKRFPDATHLVDQIIKNPLPGDSLADRETIAPRSTPADSDAIPTRGTLRIPRQLGRYRIVRKLGQGAMGSVFLAHDGQLERQVALKIPRGDLQRNREMRLRFEREAQAAAALHHPNICPLYDVGEFEGIHFISLAYVEGCALTRYAISESGLSEFRIAEVILKLAKALGVAHEAGIIHRDLKPANVMMDLNDEPIILDFGLARRIDRGQELKVTQTGAAIGSPAYMSPEQVDGDQENVGPQSDIYSLGIILYELLTGRIPFEGSFASVMGQIMTKQPDKPSDYRGDLTVRLENICLKMMAKEAKNRHSSMHAVVLALEEYLEKYNGTHPPTTSESISPTPAVDVGERRKQHIEQLIKSDDYGQAEKLMVALSRETSHDLNTVAQWAAAELPKLRKTRADVRAGRQEIYSAAMQLLKAHDYEQAVQLMEEYPYDLRTPKMQELLEHAENSTYEVQRLRQEIKAARKRGDNQALRPLLQQLLELKPADRRAKELREQLTKRSSGPLTRVLGKYTPTTVERLSIPTQWALLSLLTAVVCGYPAYRWADNFLTQSTDTIDIETVTQNTPNIAESVDNNTAADRQISATEAKPEITEESQQADPVSNEWIDLSSWINPKLDEIRHPNFRNNGWSLLHNGILRGTANQKPAKLLFPVVISGVSLEWEIAFTRTSGRAQFTTDVPTVGGMVPISIGPEIGKYKDQVYILTSNGDVALQGPCVVRNGEQKTIRIRVEKQKLHDRIEIFIDGDSIGDWTGNRTTLIKKTAPEGYPTHEQNGLYVGRNASFSFHKIRMRMLEGTVSRRKQTSASESIAATSALIERAPEKETNNEWTPLFDDTFPQQWTSHNGGRVKPGWHWNAGVLTLNQKGAGNIATKAKFSDFELAFDWKISKGGNSGVFYLVDSGNGAPQFSGPEYQILDDKGHPNGKSGKTSAGSIYGLFAPQSKRLNPVGTWNTGRIIKKGTHLEHWLNGRTVINTTMHNNAWKKAIAAGGKKSSPRVGTFPEGHIVLQDHGHVVSYRNMRIKKLTAKPVSKTTNAIQPANPAVSLFNGKDLAGWRSFGDAAGASVKRGLLTVGPTANRHSEGIATIREFSDFELQLEYRLKRGSNSGVRLRVPATGMVNESDCIEIQLIDDNDQRFKDISNWQKNGAVFGVNGPTKAIGGTPNTWHALKITADGPMITAHIDNSLVNSINVDTTRVKMKQKPRHLNRRKGLIALNGPGIAEFRDIQIREL